MAKQIKYGEEARRALEKGVNALADTVGSPPRAGKGRQCPGGYRQNHPWTQGPQRRAGQEVRRAPHHQ